LIRQPVQGVFKDVVAADRDREVHVVHVHQVHEAALRDLVHDLRVLDAVVLHLQHVYLCFGAEEPGVVQKQKWLADSWPVFQPVVVCGDDVHVQSVGASLVHEVFFRDSRDPLVRFGQKVDYHDSEFHVIAQNLASVVDQRHGD
jgi:hypothetical protein